MPSRWVTGQFHRITPQILINMSAGEFPRDG
jgi:hypothetical protein